MVTKIFTEEPEQELWRTLLRYSYKTNIRRYFEAHSITFTVNEKNNTTGTDNSGSTNLDLLSNCITGALLQAAEYYRASKSVSLQVEPLLLYYGSTNLFYALSILLTGAVPNIHNHGMRIKVEEERQFIADTQITFNNYDDGGVHIFAKNIGFDKNLCNFNPWTLADFLDSIAEIKQDFDQSVCLPFSTRLRSHGQCWLNGENVSICSSLSCTQIICCVTRRRRLFVSARNRAQLPGTAHCLLHRFAMPR